MLKCTARAALEYVNSSCDKSFAQAAPKAAAVLVPLFEDAEGVVRVILTERSSNLNTHRGKAVPTQSALHSIAMAP